MPLFSVFILQFTVRNLLINDTVQPPVRVCKCLWNAANLSSSQEGGSKVPPGLQEAEQPSNPQGTNPSAGCASRGKLTGSRNHPIKTHLKWKNIGDIISRVLCGLANGTEVLGEEKTNDKPQQNSRAAGQPGCVCREQRPE